MGEGLLDRKIMSDNAAGIVIPAVMVLCICTGNYKVGAFATLLALAAWMVKGNVKPLPWIAVAAGMAVVCWRHGSGGTWADSLVMFSAAALLNQPLDSAGKRLSKLWSLRAAAAVTLVSMLGAYLPASGFLQTVEPIQPMSGMFGTPEAAGLFFAVAALSDISLKRRCIFCTALGMTGSVLGIICLAAGLVSRKQDWLEDMLWTMSGLLWFVIPANVWMLSALFLFWCIPETHSVTGQGMEKWSWVPLVPAVLNPWTFGMLAGWASSISNAMSSWNWRCFLFGRGPGGELFAGGLFQALLELGIIGTAPLVLCAAYLVARPSGRAWVLNLLFGSCAFLPAPALLAAGTGVANVPEGERSDGKLCSALMLAMCLYLCGMGNAVR